MPYYRDALPYYYGGAFSNHSSLMTGTGRTIHSPLGSSRYAPLLSTISESPLSALRRYSPAVTISSRPKRVIDTADIDVSTPRALSHTDNNHQRNRLRRDRPTIRIRSQALKDNPALREHYERHEKTVGELLVEKFLIKDKKPDGDQEIQSKLNPQTIMESARDKNQYEEKLEAIQRKVTRRMTRRRSSADIQMDPQQIEREVLIAQAQADALDTLVAEEQAEIEVETRMGTLIRKNLVRSMSTVLGKHENQTCDDDDETRTKKLAKKVKKRKKTTDKPSPPNENEIGLEFMQKSQEDKVNVLVNDKPDETNDNSSSNKAMKFKVEASNSVGDFSTLLINAGAAEERQIQLNKSQNFTDQFRDSVRLPAPKLAAKVKTVENKNTDIEEHNQVIVLPVKKRYIKDDARNSVYLTLKTQKNDVASKVNGDLVNHVGNVDDPSQLHSNDHTDHAPRMTTTSLVDCQLKEQKVAKFRSKDITQSDVEVETISELSGGVEEIGERRTKDKGHDEPLIDSGRSNETEKKSISLSGNSIETSEGFLSDITSRSEPSKVISPISDVKSVVECNGNRELTNLCETSLKNDHFLPESTQNLLPNDQATDEITKEKKDGVNLVIGRLNDKQSDNSISSKGIGKRGKIVKRNLSALDSNGTIQLDTTKNDKKEKSVEREKGITNILSVISPVSISGNLPNAPTINLLDVTNQTADQVVKYCGTESNSLSHENQKVHTENIKVVNALTEFAKASAKLEEAETLIPIAVTKTVNEVDGPGYLRKVISKTAINDESLINESLKSATLKKNDNLLEFKDDCKVPIKNVADASKLQSNQTNFSKQSNLDCSQSDEVRSESANPKVVTIKQKKIFPALKKRAISTVKEEQSPKSPVEKEDSSIEGKDKTLQAKAVEKKFGISTVKEEQIPKSPVEKEESSIEGKEKTLQAKAVEKKFGISTVKEEQIPKSPVEKEDSSIEGKEKTLQAKAVEKKFVISTVKEEQIPKSPVEKQDSSIEGKEKTLQAKAGEKKCSISTVKEEQSPKSHVEKENSSIEGKNKTLQAKAVEKKFVISTVKEEQIPKSPVEKEDSSIEGKEKKLQEKAAEKITKSLTEVEAKVKDPQKTDEKSSKLTNGLTKVKPKLIQEIEDNRKQPKTEKPKLKIWNKTFTPPIPEDDGIDFWGEIESQRVEKPAPKIQLDVTEIKELQKISIVEKDSIDLESELKPNLPPETATQIAPKAAETLTGKENKPNKIKKKKTTESGVCKKKDQEKAKPGTILKLVINENRSDENGSQQQHQQNLSGESLEKEKSEKKSCETQEINRFERNLSTIAEENSPLSPEVPRLQNLPSVISNIQKQSTEKKLESSSKSMSDKLVITTETGPDKVIITAETGSDKLVITNSKELEANIKSKTNQPKISTLTLLPEVNDDIEETETKNSKVCLMLASVPIKLDSLPITESGLPTINIVAATGTSPDDVQNEPLENQLETIIQEEEPEGPGTPTNETNDDTPKNISKWNSQADLSLNEPEKNIESEISVGTKKESSKKKTSTKKGSSKNSSKGSGGSNSTNSAGTSPDSSKKKKLAKRKKLSGKAGNSSEKRTIFEERSESKLSNSSDTTLKPSCLNLINSPKNSPRNTPKQRPLDLIKIFYTTPASLLTATPRDLSKVRRAKIKKKKHSTRTASASSDSTGSTRSTQSTGTNESNSSTKQEDDVEQKRISSTRSNDSGFDGSPRLSSTQ